jgi:hypothetical protein
MNDHPVHRDDIEALRTEGDLKGYMRSLIRPTQTPSATTPRKRPRKWGAIPIPPDHKPGQWPPGTRPPGPPPEHDLPPEQWDAAVRDHRATRDDEETDQ